MADYPKGFQTTEITREMIEAEERFENMSPEEKEKIREKLKKERLPLPSKPGTKSNRDFLKPTPFKMSKRYGGAVMKARGGTFKGTF